MVLVIAATGCQKPFEANFDIQLDPNVPGKVNVINTSTNASTFEWRVWLKGSENGTPYTSSTYGSGLTSSEENPSFFIQEETWIQVELKITNEFLSAEATKSIEIADIPDTMILGNLVITSMDLRDEDGYEWDDTDGTPYFGGYSNSVAYPDLIVNTSQGAVYSDTDVQEWDVNIETSLPYTMIMEPVVFDNFGPQPSDFFIEVVDFDGPPGSIFAGPGKRIGYHTFNPYHLTHRYNKGDDSNYPSVYHIVADHFEADLYMNWQ